MLKTRSLALFAALSLFSSLSYAGPVYTEDFSTNLDNWTAGPSHLDAYGIVGGELFLDGYGHLTGPGGWGVLQFNESLGNNFSVSWDARITNYDYTNFTLSTDGTFNPASGTINNGYVGWLDIDDPVNPLLDAYKVSSGSATPLPGSMNVSVTPDIGLNQWMNWTLEKSDDSLKVYLNNTLYIDTLDAEFANANFKFGLSFGEDSEGYFDNVVITVNSVPEPGSSILLLLGLISIRCIRQKRFT